MLVIIREQECYYTLGECASITQILGECASITQILGECTSITQISARSDQELPDADLSFTKSEEQRQIPMI